MKNFIDFILGLFSKKSAIPIAITPPIVKVSMATGQPAPQEQAIVAPPKYLFDTPQNARHSIRVICDEEGLSLLNKNIITACIEQESGFYNYKDGKPVQRDNYYNGKIWSTDWGICQINDTEGWHIGKGLAFPTIDYVLANPEKAVRYMVHMLQAGKLKLWVSYSSGAYEKYMPQ